VRYQAAFDGKIEESYMCRETGVHSGSVYYIRNLLPSKESAQIECDQRNEELRIEAIAAVDQPAN